MSNVLHKITSWLSKVIGPRPRPSNAWHFPVTEDFEPRKAKLKTKKDIWPSDFKAKDVKKALDKQAPTLQKATTRSKTMPLVKSASKKAVSKNIKTEMEIGNKPQKQAVAIALNVQREAKSKGKKK